MAVTAHPFPYARRTLEVGGQEMAYVDEGSGPPVVMVHGNPTWGFAFRSFIEALRHDHRVVVPDHIGMGRSARPDPGAYPFTLRRRIADLTELLDKVVPEGRVDLIVHDWGGAIGLAWATAHPDRVGRVLVMNTAAFPLPPGERLPDLLRVARTPPGRLASRWLAAFNVGVLLVGPRRRLPWAVIGGYLTPYRRPADREAVVRFVDDIPLSEDDPSWWPLVGTGAALDTLADREIVVCWGMRDPAFTPRLLEEWRRRLPGAQIVRFPNAGHLVFEDAPGPLTRIAEELFAPVGSVGSGRSGGSGRSRSGRSEGAGT